MRIEVRGARKRFGRLEALKGVSFEVAAGQRLALVGPNGSGKSTLLRALLGLIDCEGTVLLGGRSPYEARIETAKRLAYVPQVAPALGASARELVNLVCLTRGLSWESVAGYATRLNLELPAVAGRAFRSLSGGMKQKLLLALAFAAQPELLVLDEPTASLDEATRLRFFELCRELPIQTTVILCSHRLEEVSWLTKHILALDEGRVRFDGPLESYPTFPAAGGAPSLPPVVHSVGLGDGAGALPSAARAEPRVEVERE